MHLRKSLCLCSVVVGMILLGTTPTQAGDWPRFRGPNGSGIAPDDKPTPTEWSPRDNLKWKVKLPGPGVSSPIVIGDKVFVTCYSGYGVSRQNVGRMENLKRHLVCVDRKEGKILWDKAVKADLPEDPYSGSGVPSHGYASHTPVSDGERVYVFFGKTGALAFDLEGKQLWKVNLGKESDRARWGSASSPILHKNILIVTASPESETIYGLDVKTGKQVWKAAASGLASLWGTPLLSKVDDNRTDLVVATARETWGLNPETGKLQWYNESLSASNSSLVENKGVVYAGEGSRGGRAGAVKVGGKDDVTRANTLWNFSNSNRFSTPVVHKDRLYLVASNIVTCLNTRTGKEVYRQRLGGNSSGGDNNAQPGGGRGGFGGRGGRGGRGRGGSAYSSPVIANEKLYWVSSNGSTYVVELGDKFKQLSVNQVTTDRETFAASPAVSNGEIFLRSDAHLYCVAETKK